MVTYFDAGLTPREKEIIRGVADGKMYKQIGCEKTVRNHMVSIKEKLGVRNRVGVVVWAWVHGLIE